MLCARWSDCHTQPTSGLRPGLPRAGGGAHAVPTQGKRLVFVTNNSTKSRKGYTKKFQELGLNVSAVRARAPRLRSKPGQHF